MINSRIAMLGVALSLTAGSAMAQAYYEVENRTSFASVPFSSVEARRAAEPMAFPDFAAGPGGTRYAASGEPSVSQGQAPVAGSMAEAQAAYPDQWAMMAEPAPADAMAGDTNFAGAVGVFTQYCETATPRHQLPADRHGTAVHSGCRWRRAIDLFGDGDRRGSDRDGRALLLQPRGRGDERRFRLRAGLS
jgi:hypothetical protein